MKDHAMPHSLSLPFAQKVFSEDDCIAATDTVQFVRTVSKAFSEGLLQIAKTAYR